MDASFEELRELLSRMNIGLLTTLDVEGRFHTRPMQLQRSDGDGALWFATSLDSGKIDDLRRDARCGVAFLESSTYVSLSGRAEIVRDPQLAREMWDATWRAWFPEGPDEPDLVLLKFVPEHAEWVRPEGGKVKAVFTMLKNAVTRTREEPAPKKQIDLAGK